MSTKTRAARPSVVLTVGHSTLSYESFLHRIRKAGVTAIADVRTVPYSRHLAHFNRDHLQAALRSDGVAYVFLGGVLGGRPSESYYYYNGVADYERMAEAPAFSFGLDRVLSGSKKYNIALMCSEHDPLDCHRCLLVGRALNERNVDVAHILSNESIASHAEIEHRLLRLEKRDAVDFFSSQNDQLQAAYRERAMKVAYTYTQTQKSEETSKRRKVG